MLSLISFFCTYVQYTQIYIYSTKEATDTKTCTQYIIHIPRTTWYGVDVRQGKSDASRRAAYKPYSICIFHIICFATSRTPRGICAVRGPGVAIRRGTAAGYRGLQNGLVRRSFAVVNVGLYIFAGVWVCLCALSAEQSAVNAKSIYMCNAGYACQPKNLEWKTQLPMECAKRAWCREHKTQSPSRDSHVSMRGCVYK